ncbi:hypothetical protein MKW94_015218 [Papaver nudicaule]|uniref:Uncharacterized protein n=1 Tax=Papaver nudicaule TaxID=74823 RepID=A0AA42AWH1_PAPNU|nr:hypothetical protein [Papaver nudicaule]
MAPHDNMEKNGGCRHFSIRGYVVKHREKDLNACWPFSGGKQAKSLPPMPAPDFKYWRCQNCTGIDVGKLPDSHGDAICLSHAEAPKSPSGLQYAFKGDNVGGKKKNYERTSLDLNVDPSLSTYRKESEAVAVYPVGDDNRACTECGANTGDNVNRLTDGKTQVMPDVNVSLTVDIGGSERGPLEKHVIHSTVSGDAITFRFANHDMNGSKEISDVGDAQYSQREGKQNSEICSGKARADSDKQFGKVITGLEIRVSDVGNHKNEALNPVKDQTIRLHPEEIDAGESDFVGRNDVNLVSNAPRPEDLPNNSIEVSGGTWQKKKAQKVRLISDILSSGGAGTSGKDSVSARETIPDNIVMEASHSKGIDLNLDLNNEGCVEENDKSVIPSNKKKRTKISQEEDQVPTLMNFAEHAREADTEKAYTADNNAINSRSRLTKHINDGKLALCQKKQKRPRIEIGQSSTARQEDAHVEVGVRMAPSKSNRNTLSRTGLDIDMNKDFSQLQDANSFVMSGPEGISGKDQFLGRDSEKYHISPATSPYPGFTAGFVQQRLDHSSATNKKAISSKNQNGLPQAKGGGNMRQAKNSAVSFKLQSKAPSGIYNNKSSTVSHGPQNISKTQSDDSFHNASQQAGLDDITMEIVELMAKNQHERRLSGEGSTQNITYSSRTENTKDSSANRMDFTDILGSEMSRMLYEKNSGSRKNSSSNDGSSISSKGKSVIPNKKKPDGFLFSSVNKNKNINFSVSQPKECSHGSLGLAPFSQNHDQPPRGFPFSAKGSSSIKYDQNFSRKEDMVSSNGFSVPLRPSLEAHQMPEKVSGNNSSRKDHHAWSPMVPNSAPFRVNSPEMFVAEPNKSKKPSQCSEPSHRGIFHRDHDLAFVDPSNIHLQKQERNYGDKTKGSNSNFQFFGAGRGDASQLKKMGPLDMYSNDQTIPAMHLLKLMDAGQNFNKQSPYPTGVHLKNPSSFEKERSKTLMPPPSSRLLNTVERFPPVLNYSALASSQKNADPRMIAGPKENNYWETYSVGAQAEEHGKRKNSSTQPRGSKFESPISLQNSGKGFSFASSSVPFMGHIKETGQTKSKNPGAQPRVHGSSSSGKNHPFVTPIFYFLNNSASVSNSMLFKGVPRETVNPVVNVESEVYNTKKRNLPVVDNRGPSSINRSERNLPVMENFGPCSINRNPADFFAPGPENKYMLSGEDLRRRSPSPERSSSKPETSNQRSIKRPKMTNLGFPYL